MAEPLRILSIGAHPADIFDQSGGTMAHHVDRGDYVGVWSARVIVVNMRANALRPMMVRLACPAVYPMRRVSFLQLQRHIIISQ